MKPSPEPTIAELRELRARAWQKLRAAVPVAIEAISERQTKLEARIDVGKKLSARDQRELDEIRALLKRIEVEKACALLSRMDLDKIQAALRQVATTTGGAR
jgi:hypothetical protein